MICKSLPKDLHHKTKTDNHALAPQNTEAVSCDLAPSRRSTIRPVLGNLIE